MLTLPFSFERLGLRGWEEEPSPLEKKNVKFSLFHLFYIYIVFLRPCFTIEGELHEGSSMFSM